jgi:hypothetical protein
MTADQPVSNNRASLGDSDAETCVLWTGPVNRGGYGVTRIGNTTTSAHRLAWIKANGPLSDELEVDHLCRNRLCVNLEHLEPVTRSENTRRAPRFQVTECPHGHPLAGENLYVQTVNGRQWRSCRICRNERSRRAAS